MALINNSIESLYNGVSEQSAEHRQNTQVKEMINAYPSIDKGLLKRNPTTATDVIGSLTYSFDMWSHAYDRGLSGESEEKYSIQITQAGMEVLNVNTGKVYTKGAGLTFDGNAESYIYPFSGVNGYSATTIKDTTFIVNKEARPNLSIIDATKPTTPTSSQTIYEANLQLNDGAFQWNWGGPFTWYGPYGQYLSDVNTYSLCTNVTRVIVDGKTITYNTALPNLETASAGFPGILDSIAEPYDTWASGIVARISSALDSSKYVVSYNSDTKVINVKKADGTTVSMSAEIEFFKRDGTSLGTSSSNTQSGTWIGAVTYNNYSGTVTTVNNAYVNDAYIWIKNSNPSAAYTYTTTLIDDNGNSVSASATETTTEAAASALATSISANANYTATSINSVVKITCTSGVGIKTMEMGDTYGNLASFGWINEVQFSTDLPKNLGFEDSVVNVTGSGESGFNSYWLKYTDSRWVETLDPKSKTEINVDLMPHILVRNSDDTFTLKAYGGWQDRLVGDSDSNPEPSFLASANNGSPTIRDIFFFKNRLGFITDRTVVMSEVGKYGNFWRTTVATLLDSDPIDTAVDTTKAIRLEYATYLEDSVMLFSDKVQFKLEGGKILSPASVQISQTSAYSINKNVRPVYINDKIFFCVHRGEHTAVMQYQVKSSNTSSEAIDITAHVQSYIPSDVMMLSGDAVNNMLFISCYQSDTVYVYKYYDVGSDRLQSAWFKYQFNGAVYRAFGLGKNLNLLIRRFRSIVAEDWVLGTGTWESAKLWDTSLAWISLPDDLLAKNQFEIMPIAPIDHASDTFVDDANTGNPTTISTNVNFGEWVASFNGKKDIRGTLKFKSVMISSEAGSDFGLYVTDNHRGDTRVIESKYTVDRKPMVYGDAKNIEVGIQSDSNIGFRINTVNYEGSFNSRSSKQ